MPQMKPLNWLILMNFFILNLMFTISINYFYFFMKNIHFKKFFKKKTFIIKW